MTRDALLELVSGILFLNLRKRGCRQDARGHGTVGLGQRMLILGSDFGRVLPILQSRVLSAMISVLSFQSGSPTVTPQRCQDTVLILLSSPA